MKINIIGSVTYHNSEETMDISETVELIESGNMGALQTASRIVAEEVCRIGKTHTREAESVVLEEIQTLYRVLATRSEDNEESLTFAHGFMAGLLTVLITAEKYADNPVWDSHFNDEKDLKILRLLSVAGSIVVFGKNGRIKPSVSEVFGLESKQRIRKMIRCELIRVVPALGAIWLSTVGEEALIRKGLIQVK